MQRFMDDDKWLEQCGSKAGDYVKSMAGATDIVLRESLHI